MIVAVLTVLTSDVCSVCSFGDGCAASNGTLAALDPLATSQRGTLLELPKKAALWRGSQDLGIIWCREAFPRVDMTTHCTATYMSNLAQPSLSQYF